MALEDTTTVDGAAYEESDNTVVLLLTDAWGWDDEVAHLRLLQDKVNAYAAFVETGQYRQVFPGAEPDHCVFDISFARPITERCLAFLRAAAAQLNEQLGIVIRVHTGGGEEGK